MSSVGLIGTLKNWEKPVMWNRVCVAVEAGAGVDEEMVEATVEEGGGREGWRCEW